MVERAHLFFRNLIEIGDLLSAAGIWGDDVGGALKSHPEEPLAGFPFPGEADFRKKGIPAMRQIPKVQYIWKIKKRTDPRVEVNDQFNRCVLDGRIKVKIKNGCLFDKCDFRDRQLVAWLWHPENPVNRSPDFSPNR